MCDRIKVGLAVIIFLLFAVVASAQTVYVRGVMKITMRTGPGMGNKIIDMINSGDALTMIERQKDWSMVKTGRGKEGWVLTRFITGEVPLSIVVEQLRGKNEKLSGALDDLKKKNIELSEGLKEKNEALVTIETSYKSIEEKYRLLQKESAEFLALKKRYNEASSLYKKQQEHVLALEKSLGKEDIKWFLSGAGVLVVGILLGLSARKKRKSSLL